MCLKIGVAEAARSLITTSDAVVNNSVYLSPGSWIARWAERLERPTKLSVVSIGSSSVLNALCVVKNLGTVTINDIRSAFGSYR